MILRAVSTHWFDIITTRHDFARAMRQLARSGAVELEAKPLEYTLPALPRLQQFFDEFGDIEKRYGVFWPPPGTDVQSSFEDPGAILEDTLTSLRNWAVQAGPLIEQQQSLETQRADLTLLQSLIASAGPAYPFARLPQRPAERLSRAIYFVPAGAEQPIGADGVLYDNFPSADGVFVVAIANHKDIGNLHSGMAAMKGQAVPIPDFLSVEAGKHEPLLRQRLNAIEKALDVIAGKLDELAQSFSLRTALSRVAALKWLYENSGDVRATQRTVRITGWTSSVTGGQLREKLDEAGINYVLSISEPAKADNAPMVLRNPGWLKAFEFFPRMLGVPGRGDTDPSVITAVVAPLMFGFMFGDIGHGAVLLIAGMALRKRMPLLALLVPGGLSAMVFGVLFGSVFAREDIIAPLWLHPLEEPVTLLIAALVIGAVLLLLGLALDALQSAWRGELTNWLLTTGGTAFAYLSLLGCYWQPLLFWGLAVGAAWSMVGACVCDNNWNGRAMAAAAAEFVETLMRLVVNSVSFVRIGAFALAHAGLSAAIVGVGEASGSIGYWPVLVLGNALIIALEGLVTGIQTTRLILFEFFIRFFKAGGREFHPLEPPQTGPGLHQGNLQ